jgi:hypothetical protein
LGVIALIVIAAINPVEQANRARDTRFKSDGAQLISAGDRYFAAKSEFPWVTTGAVTSNDAAYGFVSASDQGIGICGADCTVDGVLITSDELKTAFRNRDFVTATTADKQLFMGKPQGTSQSIYACYIPAAKSNRDTAVAGGKVYSINMTDGTRSPTTACDVAGSDWIASLCFVCIPE